MLSIKDEAAFLKNWAKGKPIRLYQPGATFWACRRYMTKIDQKRVEKMVSAGYAKVIRMGMVDWKVKPSDLALMTGTTPPPDVEGIAEILMS